MLQNSISNILNVQDTIKMRSDSNSNAIKQRLESEANSLRESYNTLSSKLNKDLSVIDRKVTDNLAGIVAKQALLVNKQENMSNLLKLTNDYVYDFTNTTVHNITHLVNASSRDVTSVVLAQHANGQSAVQKVSKDVLESISDLNQKVIETAQLGRTKTEALFNKQTTSIDNLQNAINTQLIHIAQLNTLITNVKNILEQDQTISANNFGNLGNTLRSVTDKIETSLDNKIDHLDTNIDSQIQTLFTKQDAVLAQNTEFKSAVMPRFKTLIDHNASSNKDLHKITQDLNELAGAVNEMKAQNINDKDLIQNRVGTLSAELKSSVLINEQNIKQHIDRMSDMFRNIPDYSRRLQTALNLIEGVDSKNGGLQKSGDSLPASRMSNLGDTPSVFADDVEPILSVSSGLEQDKVSKLADDSPREVLVNDIQDYLINEENEPLDYTLFDAKNENVEDWAKDFNITETGFVYADEENLEGEESQDEYNARMAAEAEAETAVEEQETVSDLSNGITNAEVEDANQTDTVENDPSPETTDSNQEIPSPDISVNDLNSQQSLETLKSLERLEQNVIPVVINDADNILSAFDEDNYADDDSYGDLSNYNFDEIQAYVDQLDNYD